MRTGQAVDLAWEGHPLLSHLGKQAVDSFRSFEEALVTEGQEYDVIALPAAPVGHTPGLSAGRHSRSAATGCHHARPLGHTGSFGACASLPRGST